jgi:peptidyl-tRNA hydrolase
MTTKEAFPPDEWKAVVAAPPTAGMIVVTAAHGGAIRETFAMSKAYAEARSQHGASELLDEIVAAKPKVEHSMHHSAEEFRNDGLLQIRQAVSVLEGKATSEELEDYRRFVLNLANRVAAAHREEGQAVSPAEAEAIQQITSALGAAPAA